MCAALLAERCVKDMRTHSRATHARTRTRTRTHTHSEPELAARVSGVYTFAAPRFACQQFSDAFGERYAGRAFRYVRAGVVRARVSLCVF